MTAPILDEGTFHSYISLAKILSTDAYCRGYQYGLRRCYHGENFGEPETLTRIAAQKGEIAAGLQDGLAGRRPVTS